MSRSEFLDILKDYLKGYFSDFEISDILRDYEEFFINGELSGKSDEETIKTLGSPKLIAKELIRELKTSESDNINDNINDSFLDKCKEFFEEIKNESKKIFEKGAEFFSSSKILNTDMSSTFIKFLLFALTVALLFPMIFIAIGVVFSFAFLVSGSLGNFLGYIFSIIFISTNVSVGTFGIFLNLMFTGVIIILWVTFISIIRFLKNLILQYISFLKTKNMYIKLKKKKEDVVYSEEDERNE